jgi:hypothetical protein
MADPTSPDPSKVALVTGASEASVSRHLSPVNVQHQGARAFTVRARRRRPARRRLGHADGPLVVSQRRRRAVVDLSRGMHREHSGQSCHNSDVL